MAQMRPTLCSSKHLNTTPCLLPAQLGELVLLEPPRPRLPDVNLRDDSNCTPLHVALLSGKCEVGRKGAGAGRAAGRQLWGSGRTEVPADALSFTC